MRFHFSCTRNPHTEREVYTMRTPRLRLLSALLAVALFFTLLPVSALAEGGGSNANTGLTIGIVGNLNQWVVSHSISMKEVSPAVYEVTFENKSYGDINGSVGFLFVKDNSFDNSWGFGTVSSGELHDAFYGGDYIKIDPGSDDESAVRNFIVRLDLTNWDWGTITGATFTITVTAPSRDFTFDATTGTIKKYNGNDAVVNIPSEINGTPVTTIGNAAFRDSSVTSVTIPANVTEIGANAFAGCTNLTSVNYAGDWSNLTIQSGNPAVEDAANAQLFDFAFTPDNTAVIVRYKGTAADVTIPSRYKGKPVTAINNAVFPNSAVTSVTIPDSVTSIHDVSFFNCSQLTNISIPNSVTYIGYSAFSYCTSLKSITLPSSLSTISRALFSGCSQLTTIHIPDSVSSIQFYAFHDCENLKTIRIPVSVTSIRDFAFDGCPSSMTVTYPGSKKQWDDIDKGSNNDVLENNLICAMLEATFDPDNGESISTQTIDRGGKFTEPAAPSKENHTFAGWYNGDEPFDFDADTTNDPNVLKLVAKWNINKYTVQFVSDYGNAPTSQNVPYNGTADDPGKLTEEGYTFDGWYTDDTYSTEFDFTQPIKRNTTVYAKWTAKNYEVSFITEHGKTPTSQNVPYNETADDPGKLTEDGYTFIGWYTDHTCTTEFNFSTPITGDTKVYAKWEKNAPVLPDTYALNVSGAFVYVDGVDVTASAGDTSLQLEKDASVRLVADPDRMPSGMVFDRWTILNGALNADDAEKFETGRTLEEFAFTMPAEPLSIEATPRMQEEEGSDTVSVIAGVTLGTAATALVAWQAYDLGMSLYQEHWLPADFVMPKTRAELALLLWNTAGRPAPAAQPAFTDITDPDTAQAAQWAVETGLMTPKSADLFKPEKSVTRWKAVRSWKRVTNQNT